MGTGAQAAAVTGPRRLGRYELLSKIAAGGMAEVFLARQHGPMGFQKVVVVKTIHEHLAEQQSFIDMFLDEARISALIKHHNVVDIYDLGVQDGTYFIAMEYIPGQALSKVLGMCHRTGERLDVMLTVDLIAAAAHGLDAAHNLKGITGEPLELVHRDVSPGNILVSYNGAVKLVDFGVAKSLGSISASQSSVLKGKIGYASPEQLEDSPLDRRSDIFSLGVVLWEALTCARLYRGKSAASTVKMILDGNPPPPSSRRPGVPPELDALCLKALARDPADRFQTAGEMRAALLGVLQANQYHADNEVLAGFMSETFADERSREVALLRDLAASEVEIELFEVASMAGAAELIELSEDDDDEPEIELVVDDDEPEISIEPPEPPEPPVLVDDSTPALEPLTGDSEKPVTGPTEVFVDPPRFHLGKIGAAVAAVLALALIASLVVGGGDDTPAASDTTAAAPAETAEPPATPVASSQPDAGQIAEPEPEPEPDAATETLDPRSEATRLSALGDEAFAARQSRAAKKHYKAALEHDKNHAPALRGLTRVYLRYGRGKSARYYLNRYLRAAPNAPDARALRRRVFRSIR